MGTVASLTFGSDVPLAQVDVLAAEAFAWLDEVDQRFSTYRADSEVNQFVRRELTLAESSVRFREVMDACAQLWRETDGYFDAHASGQLDPSGYVKGWSIRVASDLLVQRGAPNHLVEVGGDVQARGAPRPGDTWDIGLRHPFSPADVFWVVRGRDIAVATSGNYERGEHVVNPRTGAHATELKSVTVVGPDIARADAYATAVFAMRERAALAWLAATKEFTGALVTGDGRLVHSPDLPGKPADPAA